jgi:hypothetical protein
VRHREKHHVGLRQQCGVGALEDLARVLLQMRMDGRDGLAGVRGGGDDVGRDVWVAVKQPQQLTTGEAARARYSRAESHLAHSPPSVMFMHLTA